MDTEANRRLRIYVCDGASIYVLWNFPSVSRVAASSGRRDTFGLAAQSSIRSSITFLSSCQLFFKSKQYIPPYRKTALKVSTTYQSSQCLPKTASRKVRQRLLSSSCTVLGAPWYHELSHSNLIPHLRVLATTLCNKFSSIKSQYMDANT